MGVLTLLSNSLLLKSLQVYIKILCTVLGARVPEMTVIQPEACGLVGVSLNILPLARCSNRSMAQLRGVPFTLKLTQLMEIASPELTSAPLVGLYLVPLSQWDGKRNRGTGVRDGDQSVPPCRIGKLHG